MARYVVLVLALISCASAAPWRCYKASDATVCLGDWGQPCIAPPAINIPQPSPPCIGQATVYTPCGCPPPPPPPCPVPYYPPPCPEPIPICPPPPCPVPYYPPPCPEPIPICPPPPCPIPLPPCPLPPPCGFY